MITVQEKSLFDGHAKTIDYDAIKDLHYLGNYERNLPVSLTRMMENAYDWEHLPFVHPGSFSAITKIEAGRWGWRARAQLPPENSEVQQYLQLLVDIKRGYWATTVISGSGQGVQIHTQANRTSDDEISIDVRFYLETGPVSDEMAAMTLAYLQNLYAQLYDEDEALMQGRQAALDYKKAATQTDNISWIDLGRADKVETELPMLFELKKQQFCLNRVGGKWIIYSAVCPHLLGPLHQSEIGAENIVTCPWHGYRFDISTGRNIDGKCGNLTSAPHVCIEKGHIIARY